MSRRQQQHSTVGCWVVPVLASGEGCYPVAQHWNWSWLPTAVSGSWNFMVVLALIGGDHRLEII